MDDHVHRVLRRGTLMPITTKENDMIDNPLAIHDVNWFLLFHPGLRLKERYFVLIQRTEEDLYRVLCCDRPDHIESMTGTDLVDLDGINCLRSRNKIMDKFDLINSIFDGSGDKPLPPEVAEELIRQAEARYERDVKSWALMYAIERMHEPNGVSGAVVEAVMNAPGFNPNQVLVTLEWGDEDQKPLGGMPIDKTQASGCHVRLYVVEVTDEDINAAKIALSDLNN